MSSFLEQDAGSKCDQRSPEDQLLKSTCTNLSLMIDSCSKPAGYWPLQSSSQFHMPIRQERRDSERVPCKLVLPFEMMKRVSTREVKLIEGLGHGINRSLGGMLLLLPQKVTKRQVVEIQAPSNAKNKPSTTLMEVCWTRSIPISARSKMYVAGTRLLFEVPALPRGKQIGLKESAKSRQWDRTYTR